MSHCDRRAPPFHLLAGLVRNGRESRALVALDLHVMRHKCILDHLLSCVVHEQELERLHAALKAPAEHENAQLNAALPLVSDALVSIRAAVQELMARADANAAELSELCLELEWFRSSNQVLVDELRGEGCEALAAAKHQLWQIEDTLLHNLRQMQSELQSL